MLKDICNKKYCTACQACKNVCPKQCISMQPDELDCLYPQVDQTMCIDCHLCEMTCPANHTPEMHATEKVYAAWSRNDKTRSESASGGIATELYHWALRNNVFTAGVTYSCKEGCHFIPITHEKDISKTQNSKYVYSDPQDIYKQITKILLSGQKVLFIGLPCQVAALKQLVKPKMRDKLICVDIICHGVPPQEYLEQHLKHIEEKKKKKADRIFFRDPLFGTNRFHFTLYASGRRFYNKTVDSLDTYQTGYHKALIYRENCYVCHYARPERLGDITISDFSGLGQIAPFEQENKNISCILSNTPKGALLLEELQEYIVLEERPASEAFLFEKQLKHPSTRHSGRKVFLEEYKKEKRFEQAASLALKKDLRRNLFAIITQKNNIRPTLRKLLPKRFKKWAKGLLKIK